MIWRWFWREWRSPSLLIVWLALTLAVACVLALGSIGDRIERGMNTQSREFLAADRVLRASHPIPQAWLAYARQQGLIVSEQIGFMTMTYAGDKPQLASVKAVDLTYPLYGALETQPANLKPQPGEVLVAQRLLDLLGVKPGEQIEVGDVTLRVAGELIAEPDAGFNPFQIAPKILINLSDVEKSGAIQPGSRLTYVYMFAGGVEALNRFGDFLAPQLQPDQRWFGVEGSGTSVGKSLARAQYFLLLSTLLTLLLAVTAIAVAMGHYCRSRYDLVAVLKTLGADRRALNRLMIGQWLLLILLAALCGSAAGKGFEWAMVQLLTPVLPGQLPAASYWPWLWALVSLLLISVLVGARPYRQLLATRPLRVLRRDTVVEVWPLRYYLPTVMGVLLLLLAWMVGFNPLWWTLLLAISALAMFLALLGYIGLVILRRLTLGSLPLRLASNRLLRQPWVTISQLASFSLSFMLMALLLVLRGGLLERWQQQLPPDSPNYFLLNISQEQLPQVRDFLQQQQISVGHFYPIVRARLTEINDHKAVERVAEDAPGGEALNRELNLTWQAELPEYSPLTEGHWPPAIDEVSMEQRLADQLGVKIGDVLTFSGDTLTFKAKVSSLRRVDWESLRPNFYFIFPPKALDNQPQSWMTSFRHQGDDQQLTQLNRQFPTLSLLDIRAMIKQVGQVLQQVSRALEVMVVLVVACGFLLLLAQIQVGMRQRRQELIVYRVLGATQSILRSTLWAEFALLGAVAGTAATVGAEVALWLLQRQVFDFPWEPNHGLWLGLPLFSTLLLSLCGGWLGIRLLRGKALSRRYDE